VSQLDSEFVIPSALFTLRVTICNGLATVSVGFVFQGLLDRDCRLKGNDLLCVDVIFDVVHVNLRNSAFNGDRVAGGVGVICGAHNIYTRIFEVLPEQVLLVVIVGQECSAMIGRGLAQKIDVVIMD